MKKEKNRKRKEIRRRTHSLQYRMISFMCALLLICSTVLLDTGYISMASSFDDESIVEEVATDEFDPDVEVQDTEGSDVDFQQTDDVEGESIEEAGGMDAGALDFSSEADWSADTFAAGDAADNAEEKVTYTKLINNDSIEVKAEVLAGALPEGTELQVNPIEEGTEQYTDIAGRLNEQAQNSEEELAGFFAYDIYFTDAEGQKAEPTAKVQYSFQYTEATAPQLADPSTAVVKTVKIQKNAETNETELVQLNAEADQLAMEVNESRQLQKAGFQSANTAAFAFTWTTKKAQATEPVENQPEQPAEGNTEEVIEQPTEETVQTPIGTIQITEDEVNVRTSPSTEAEILDVVFAGDQLPLLETITAEDGSIWFKVLYGESIGYVRNDVAEVVEEQQEAVAEDVPQEETPAEITRYDYQSDEVNVKVTLTNPEDLPDNAELSVTPVEISQETEDQITKEAIEAQKVIENIRAYDIKFLVDGEEVQPGATVRVEVSFPNEDSAEDANVYHVDNEENIENMDGSINAEGNVEFETTHFSTYVIVNTSLEGTVQVTLQHYDVDTKQPIYAETVKPINVGGKIPDYRATENYDVQSVVIVENNKETPVADKDNVQIAKDTTVRVYYKAKSTTAYGDMALYDYQIRPGKGKQSINVESNYPANSSKNNRMTMGTQTANGTGYNAYGTNSLNANNCNYGKDTGGKGTLGLVKGLSEDYSTVLWNVDQPGFFTDSNCGETKGKQKYTNYKLNFSKEGNKYTLTGVTRPDNTIANAGADFYPLNSSGVTRVNDGDGKNGNYYFGIRYDVEFQLGDYIGPLNYEFTGDDDLWVLLDGKVVIDVGGIHDALKGSTDLWEDLGFKDGARPTTNAEKNATHRITVLYMERGAGASNCQMNFTIPDARFVDVNNVPLASITLHKVNSKNEGIAGAKFKLVNDNGGETYPFMTSDDSGNVTFNNLKEGIYTLTEIMAPNGYVALKETYKVKVTVEGDIATAKLYKADGTTEVEGNNIVNYTETEEAEKNLTSSKTAKVVDYEKRIYQIDLNAATTGREAGVEAKGASVVMVLDASGSMAESITGGSSKIDALKTAAKSFVNRLSNQSKDSEISIIWYSGSEGQSSDLTTTQKFTKLSESGVETLIDKIDYPERTIYGGTPMGAALEAAKNQLNQAHYKNRYVLFMTDGLPGYWSYNDNRNCMVANNAVKNANEIKDTKQGNAILYTVGVGLSAKDTFNWKEGHSEKTENSSGHEGWNYVASSGHQSMTGSTFLSQKIATQPEGNKNYAFTTDNLTELTGIFDDIAGRIGDLFTVQPKQIVDVIDARFKLTEASKNSLLALNNDEKTAFVSIVENEDGTTTITWTGNAAKIGNAEAAEDSDKGWRATFQIQAKDDFIGGNMIPTNGTSSGIYLDGGAVKKFEQPSVNVKLLNLKIDNKEVTLFKGDPINAQNFRNELAGTIGVVELDGKTTTLTAVNPQESEIVKLPELTDEEIQNLTTNKELTIGSEQTYKYIYPGSNEAVGYFTYTYKLVKSDNAGQHTANVVGNAVEQYQLTVTYHPYSLDERKELLSGTTVQEPNTELYTNTNAPKDELVGRPKGGEIVSSELTATGTYTVNVIAGELQITKKLDVPADQDETFNFVIKDKDQAVVATAVATVRQGESEITAVFTLAENANVKLDSDNQKLIELSRGNYTVEEVLGEDAHYELQSIVAGVNTNCYNAITKDQQSKDINITFAVGTDKEQTEVLKNGNTDTTNGRIGVAEFTNKKTVVDIDFEKVDIKTTTDRLSGAEFTLYKADANGEKTGDPISTYTSDRQGKISINNLPTGNYVLVETKAPTGYQLSAIPWKIIVANDRTVTVTYNGNNVATRTDDNKIIHQLTNAKIYSLPSSGGSGTYLYTISGVAFITAALLLFINNKRKEGKARA